MHAPMVGVDSPEALVERAIAVASGREGALSGEAVDALRREVGRFVAPSAGRLLAALDALLADDHAAEALEVLLGWGALGLWLPEVAAMDGLHRSAPLDQPHKDLWAHTLQVLGQCPRDPDLRWVALCHDIGKPATRTFGSDGVTFWRHEAVGAWLFLGLGARLGMAGTRVARIAFVIANHARTNQYDDSWSDRALRRLRRECGPWLDDMIAFSRADWSTRRVARVRVIQAGLDRLVARLAALDAEAEADDAAPTVGLARALLEVSGEASGPWVGDALRWAREARRAGDLAPAAPAEMARFVLAARAAWGAGSQNG